MEISFKKKKKNQSCSRNSLAVQWLGLGVFTAIGQVQFHKLHGTAKQTNKQNQSCSYKQAINRKCHFQDTIYDTKKTILAKDTCKVLMEEIIKLLKNN